jgi:hypothetical protein
MALVNAGVDDAYLGAPVLVGIGLPFLAAYLVDRQGNWWALIPMWVMAVLTAVLLVGRVSDKAIGTLVFWSVGLPFLVVYLSNHSRKWALIPAFVLLVVGLIPLLTLQVSENMIGTFFLFAISVPFWVIFFYRPEKWWALIPAGIMTTLALVALISSEAVQPGMERWIAAVLYIGIGATFSTLWLRQNKAATGWAKYPAVILLAVGVLSLIFGERMQEYLFAAAIISLGLWILYTNLRLKKNI